MVTHFEGWPGQESARSSSSMAPLRFFSFFTRLSTAFSAHFSSSSPCFQPSSFLTAGDVKENSEPSVDMALLVFDSTSSVSILLLLIAVVKLWLWLLLLLLMLLLLVLQMLLLLLLLVMWWLLLLLLLLLPLIWGGVTR